jgi:anthranilate synthase component 1
VTGTCLSHIQPYEEFLRIAENLTGPVLIPVTMTFPLPDASPATLYRNLRTRKGFLLESMEGVPRRAVRSIIGTGIEELFTIPGGPGEHVRPIEHLRQFMEQYTLAGAPGGFSGGLVGYCSYDMVTHLNEGYLDAGKDRDCPAGRFMVTSSGVVLNHQEGICTVFVSSKVGPGDDVRAAYEKAAEEVRALGNRVLEIQGDECQKNGRKYQNSEVPVSSPMSREEFTAAVEKTLEHIRAGDIFQAVISRKFESPYPGDPFRIYQEIRELNPSPYLYFMEFGDETIIGSSPEMLVKVDGDDIFTVPIAGTRPRGRDESEDARLAEEMLHDEKEKAEHLMLVDLARNDIGRVAAFGSVKVTSFMEVEKFSHVQHITSIVKGTLRDGSDRFDALGSCFPAGTVSGAPKLRAMQIIAGLEAHPRGIYAGAVGYIGFDDRLEFAIAIRTAIVRNGIASFQTGAGIVADSDPGREYEETRQKAGAMLTAISRSLSPGHTPTCTGEPGGMS